MYNEEENVVNTVNKLKKALKDIKDKWEIVLVDDGSTDRTLEIAKGIAEKDGNVQVFSYFPNAGRGKALRTGFSHSQGEIIVTLDADLSYDPQDIPMLFEELKKDKNIDLIIGSPYLKGGKALGVPFLRLLISKLGNKILGFALPGKLGTVTGIFRAYRRKILDSLELESEGKEIHLEILSKVLALKYKVKEIPSTLRGRKKGKSKFKFAPTAYSHILFSFYERPMILFGMIGLVLLILGLLGGIYISILWLRTALNPERPLMTLIVLLIIGGIQILFFGFLANQIGILRNEIYKVQKENKELRKKLEK
jgi:glycosyltransferase involved in cell wall biosynthesis